MDRLFRKINHFSRKIVAVLMLTGVFCANLWAAKRESNNQDPGTYDLSINFFGSGSPLSNGDDLYINYNDKNGVIIILPENINISTLSIFGTGTCEIKVRGYAKVAQFILGDKNLGGNANVTISAADEYSSVVFDVNSFDTTTFGASYKKTLDISDNATVNITSTWEANSSDNFTGRSSDIVINNSGTLNVTGAINAQSATPTTTINGSGTTNITGVINGEGASDFKSDIEANPNVLLAPAGTFIWQGGDSTNPTDWDTGANWIGGTVPNDSSKDVLIKTASNYPVVANGVTVQAKSIEVKTGAKLTFAGNVTMSSLPELKGNGTVIINGTLNQDKGITANSGLSYECGSLILLNSFVCEKILVNGTTTFATNNNLYFLVAENEGGITFGGDVTINAGTNQALLAGNVYTKDNNSVNINVVSGTCNHTKENNNGWDSWSEKITVNLQNDGTGLGLGENEENQYNVKISADSGDVYFVGTGILSSIDDSACDCNIHFGNSDDYDNKFYFDNDITFNTENEIVLDGSCAVFRTVTGKDNITLTLNGVLTNYSNRLSSSKLGANFVFNKETTISAGTAMGSSSLQFSDVTFKDSAMVYGENEYDNLTVQIQNEGLFSYFAICDSQTITGDLILKGYDADNKLNISDYSSGYNPSFKINGTQLNGEYLKIDSTGPTIIDSTGSDGLYYSYDSEITPAGSAAPSGWMLIARNTFIWQGGTTGSEDDWNTASNWIPQQNPATVIDANIIIPSGKSNYPSINQNVMTAAGATTTPYSLKSLKIENGANLYITEDGSLKVDGLTLEGTAEIQVNGSVTINDDFTNSESLYGAGTLIIPSGKTLTVPDGSNVKLKLENNGTVSCGSSVTFKKDVVNNDALYCGMGGTSTFEGEYSGTGTFYASNILTVFKKNVDFSNASYFGSANGELVIYCNNSDGISFKAKDGMALNQFYFWGNVDIYVTGSISANQIGMHNSHNPTWNASSDYTAKITGTGTINIGTGIMGTGIYIDRCSATDGVIGTLEIDTIVNCDSKIETHAGTKLVINEGKSLSVNSFGHKDKNTSPKAQVDIKGNLVVTNTMDLSEATGQSTAGANQINISSTGKLTAKNIKWTNDASYSNASDTNPFINNGELEISDSIILPDFTNAPYSGDGKIILNGSSATIQNNYENAAGISIKNLESKNNAIINNAAGCLLKIDSFTSPDAANTNTITFGGDGNTQVNNLTSKCIIENNSNLSLETAALESRFTNNGTLNFESLSLSSADFTNNGTLIVLTSGSSISSGNLFTNSAAGRIISETSGTEAVLSLKTNFTDNGNNSGASSISDDVKILFNGTENQSFTPNTTNDICYTNAFEVDKSGGEFTFAGDFKGSNLSLTDGKVIFNGSINITDGTDFLDADFDTTDDIIISGGTPAAPKLFKAKSIKTAGSIVPLDGSAIDSRQSFLKLVSTDGNIEIGANIGASTNYYNTVVLNAGSKDITVTGNIYTSNIDVTCNSVDFKDLIYVGGVAIHAQNIVSVNGLESESLTIDPTANKVKMGGIIKLTNASNDLVIDYPLEILDGTISSDPDFNAVFDVAGNIILRDNTTNNTIGSINSDGTTPRSIKLKAGTGKSIQVQNGNSLNAGFGKVNALDVVQFASDLVLSENTTINAATVSFIEDNISASLASGATNVILNINADFENTKIVTIVPPVVIDGKLRNSGELSLSGDITVSGNFADSGTWNHTSGKSIILNGAGTQASQTFAAKDDSVDYNIVVKKTETNSVVEFTNAITLTHLDCSTNSYKGKLKFTGTGNQKLVPESVIYSNIEINKVDATGNPASLFTFDGNLSVENLAIADGSVQFNGNITLTDGTNILDADFDTTDDIIISGGTPAVPKLFTAKSIKTAGSIIPLDGSATTDRNSYINLTSTDGNIEIGANIGASTNYYNTVVLNAGSKDITVSGNIYTSNIDVTCNSVNFEHLIYVGGVAIHAQNIVSVNGLESESLQIDSTAQTIKMGSLIKLTNASNDLIIDYPLQILNGSEDDFNAVFDVAGNIILCDNTTNNTIGSINSDGTTPRSIKLKAGTGKSIQVQNGNSLNAGFGKVNALDVVNFQSDLVLSQSTAIKAGTVSFIEDNIGAKIAASATGVELTIDGDLVNSKKITFEPPVIVKDDLTNNDSAEITFSSTSDITGNVTNGEGSTLTFTDASTIGGNLTSSGTVTSHDDITLSGNFTDTGTWTQDSGKSIILNGTGTQSTQTFDAKNASVDYSIVVNKSGTDGVVEFTNVITLTHLDCSANSYKGKLKFTGTGNQSFKPETSPYSYAYIEIDKKDVSGNPAGTFTFTDNNFEATTIDIKNDASTEFEAQVKANQLSVGKSTSTTFNGYAEVGTFTDTANSGTITFVDGGVIRTDTTFNTTSLLTIGSAADTFAFESADATPVRKNVTHTAGETVITANVNANSSTFNKMTNSGNFDTKGNFISGVTENDASAKITVAGTYESGNLTNSGTITVSGAFEADATVNNGTLTLGTTGKFSGNYSGTGATFNAASGNTQFLENVDLSGTTFNANGGTVIFANNSTVTFTAKSDGSTVLNDVTINSGAKVTTASTFKVKGNWINSNTSDSDFCFTSTTGTITFTKAGTDNSNHTTLSISGYNKFYDFVANGDYADITFNDKNNFHDVTFSGNNCNITFQKANQFNDAAFSGENCVIAFNDSNTFKAATFNSKFATITFDKSNIFNNDVLFENIEKANQSDTVIEFKDANTFNTKLTFTGKKATVKFAANKTQTVNTLFSSVGDSGANEELILTTNAASPSTSDKTTWWTLYWVNNSPGEDYPSSSDFEYTKIEYSTAVAGVSKDKDISHDWGATVKEGVGASTSGWFLRDFYWFGTVNDSWTEPGNWYRKPTATTAMSFYPPYNTGLSNITIVKNDSGILNLGTGINGTNSIKIASLTVDSGAAVDLGTCGVETEKIVNNGKICLNGSQSIQKLNDTTNRPFIQNADSSTVEYYGNCNSIPLSGNSTDGSTYDITGYALYGNLEFTGNAETSDITKKLKISGTTLIENPSDKSIKLSGSNIFTGKITVGNSEATPAPVQAGNITINSASDMIFTANTDCTNLTITADSKDVTFEGDVTTTALSIDSDDLTFKGSVTTSTSETDSLTITAAKIYTTGTGGGSGESITGSKIKFTGDYENSGKITINNSFQNDGNFTNTSSAEITFADESSITGDVTNGTNAKITFQDISGITGDVTNGTNAQISFQKNSEITGNITNNTGAQIIFADESTVSGDIANNSTAQITFADESTITGNITNSSTAQLTFQNDSEITGNTVNSGTIVFETINTVIGNITNNTGSQLTFEGDSTITGNFTNNGNFEIYDSHTITIKDDETHTGNLVDTGTWTSNTSTVIFEGTKNQQFTTNPATAYSNFTVNKNSGDFTVIGKINSNIFAITKAPNVSFNDSVNIATFNTTTASGNVSFMNGGFILSATEIKTSGDVQFNSQQDDEFVVGAQDKSVLYDLTHTSGKSKIYGKLIAQNINFAQIETFDDVTINGSNITFGNTTSTGSLTIDGADIILAQAEVSDFLTINGADITVGQTKVSDSLTIDGADIILGQTEVSGTLTIDGTDINFDKTTVSGIVTISGDNNIFNKEFTAQDKVTITANTKTDIKGSFTAGNETKFTGDVNILNVPVSIQSGNLTFDGKITASGNVQITCNQITFEDDVTASGTTDFTITNAGVFKTVDGKNFTYGTNFEQNGTARNEFGGSFTGTGNASFATDVVLYGQDSSDVEFSAGAGKQISIQNDLLIALGSSRKLKVNNSASSKVLAKNIVLYSGDVTVDGTLSSANQNGDILLLGENYSTKDSVTQFENEFVYEQTRLSSPKYSLNSNIAEFTTLAGNANHFAGKVTFAAGSTLHAGQNFYANGLTLQGNGEWNLEIPRTDDAAVSFAEAMNCEIKNSKVSCWETGFTTSVQKIAAYNCTDNSGNTNWDFDDFVILAAYTVRDNVVCVEFSSPIRNLHGEINGKSKNDDDSTPSPNNMISYFTYSDNANQTSYSNIYLDADCQSEVHGDIEATSGVYKFFLKAASNSSWNTDATGTSAGTTSSTNRAGEHKNAIPFIDIPRALAGNNYILTNKWGKRLNNYSTRCNNGTTYDGVTDKTGPVLYSVRTGQELHSNYDYTVGESSEHSYDSHNFIEFRYSEKVNFNNDVQLNTIPSENIVVTDSFGAIKENITQEGPLSFAGLGKIENGKIYTGKDGNPDKYVNTLYRKDEYSIRISVAGLTEGTVTDSNGYDFKKWIGYIEQAVMPSGTVTFLVDSDKNNNFVKDYEGNCQIEYPTASLNTIPTVNSSETALYGAWDISEPVFAINRRNKNNLWKETLFGDVYESEAIGNTSGVGSTLDKIEFHLYDNTPEFGSDVPEWFSEVGWTVSGSEGNKSELYRNYTYAADIFGGARQFDSDESRRTSGGIRYSTIYKSANDDAFTFALGELSDTANSSINMKFDTTKQAIEGAASLIFMGTSSPRRTAENCEGLYFALPLKETNYDIKQRFTVKYDDSKGYITDLAGNRLRTQILTTIDRTPPSFDMTICPVGQKEIQLIFVKKLRLSVNENPIESINYVDNSGNPVTITETIENLIPQCFDIVKINDDGTVTPSSDLRIDTSVPAEFKTVTNANNSTFTYIKLALNRPVTVQDISELYIRVVYIDKYGEFSTDLFTNHSNSRVTFIQDESNNYMQMYTAHPLSDFAVGVINPLYAYDTEMVDDDGNIISDEIMHKNLTDDVDSESWAVHDWNANQNNYGTLPAKRQVAIVADTTDGTQENETAPVNFRIYLSNGPDNGSVSTQINKDMKPEQSADGTWTDWRIWLPNVTGDVLKSLSEKNNGNWKSTDSELLSTEKNNRLIFNIEKAITDTWQAGNQITFLFGLTDDEGNPVRIMHAPELDVDHDKQYLSTSTKSPLYALRQTKADDMMSLDLWSFKLKSQASQRGGVTIMNNVIDSTTGEKVVVKVDVPKEGKLNVLVMTLDGNIVDYLHRGVESGGEHFYSWDGSNRNGNPVARGMYFIRVVGDGIDETRKVMVVKE